MEAMHPFWQPEGDVWRRKKTFFTFEEADNYSYELKLLHLYDKIIVLPYDEFPIPKPT